MSNIIQFPKIIILLLLCTFATFVGLLFTPALPEIGADFGVSGSVAARTMSIFLVGYALGQLPYGPLANRFGRKQAITIGCIIALIGTVMAYFASALWVLLVARFIQAIGSSVGLKIAFTMVGDRYSGPAAAKAISSLSTAFGFMPGLAAAIGGFVTVAAGWRGCFLALSVFVVLLWLLTRALPETARELHPHALKPSKLIHGYLTQFKDSYLVLHGLLAGLTTAIIYIFATIAPYIAIEKIGLNPDEFGLWAFVPSLGLFVGALSSRKVSHLNPRLLMLQGILMILTSSVVLSIAFAQGIINVWTLFIPTFFIYIGNIFVWSNALAHGLSGASDKSNAAAVVQFINVGTATLGVFLIEVARPTAPMLFPTVLGVILLLLFVVWLKLKAHHTQKR